MDENNKVKALKEKALELGVSKTDIDNCNNKASCIEDLIEYKKLTIQAEKEATKQK